MTLCDLKSARLSAASWEEISEYELTQLFADAVVRWLPPGFQSAKTDTERRHFLWQLSGEAEIIALTDVDGVHIGIVILAHGDPERHLGYLFAQQAWGRGYATELLRALQDLYATQPVCLIGGVMAQNAASSRALEKTGFERASDGADWTYRWQSPAQS